MNEVKVSVLCLAYNHEKYINKCLEGIVNQNTDFNYEVIINDDCSTDKTAEIIKQYEEKYPDIIKPIYQIENQDSQGVNIMKNFLLPKVSGKYIALCECDDYWIDNNKLQIQYNYMESHPDCYLCAHSSILYNCKNSTTKYCIKSKEDRDLTLKEIVDRNSMMATASLFMRKEVRTTMPSNFYNIYFGDYQIPIYAALLGKVHYINKVMSQYNYMSDGSWSATSIRDVDLTLKVLDARIQLLNNANKFSSYKYDDIFEFKIKQNELNKLYIQDDYRAIIKNDYYKHHKNLFSKKQRLIISLGCISKNLVILLRKIKYRVKR